MLDQQLAATLQARIGDTVTITPRAGAAPQRFRVSGVALITAPDVVFQPLNPLLGPAPGAAAGERRDHADRDVRGDARARSCPRSRSGAGGTAAVPGAQTGVQWQVQAQVDPRGLGGTPGTGATRAPARSCTGSSATLPGQVQFVDNLSDQLNTAAGDALYAETLYIMLAVPGALIALGLAYLAALGTVERDRRDLALLRARGRLAPRPAGDRRAPRASLIGVLAGLLGAGARARARCR